MPNWVQNRLVVKGKDADKVLEQYIINQPSETCDYTFDFNRIKEMPVELGIQSGGITDNCIKVYLSTLSLNDFFDTAKMMANAELFPGLRKNGATRLSEEEINEIIKHCIDFNSNSKGTLDDPIIKSKEDVVAYGKKAVDNVKKFGSKDWYDWCCKNWGTKWNACYTFYDKDEPQEVEFQTAWSDVRGLIAELSKKHPENTFFYDFAEEQLGHYTGVCIIKNGEFLMDSALEENSKDAYELGFDLWGDENKEHFRFNEKSGTYEYIDEDGGTEDAEM